MADSADVLLGLGMAGALGFAGYALFKKKPAATASAAQGANPQLQQGTQPSSVPPGYVLVIGSSGQQQLLPAPPTGQPPATSTPVTPPTSPPTSVPPSPPKIPAGPAVWVRQLSGGPVEDIVDLGYAIPVAQSIQAKVPTFGKCGSLGFYTEKALWHLEVSKDMTSWREVWSGKSQGGIINIATTGLVNDIRFLKIRSGTHNAFGALDDCGRIGQDWSGTVIY